MLCNMGHSSLKSCFNSRIPLSRMIFGTSSSTGLSVSFNRDFGCFTGKALIALNFPLREGL